MPEIDIKKLLLEKKPTIDKIIERWIPKEFDMEFMNFVFGNTKYEYNVDVVNKTISNPIWEFLERGGKRWRPSLFLLIVEALGGDKEKVFDFVIILPSEPLKTTISLLNDPLVAVFTILLGI